MKEIITYLSSIGDGKFAITLSRCSRWNRQRAVTADLSLAGTQQQESPKADTGEA
jgi:hypothetical protein